MFDAPDTGRPSNRRTRGFTLVELLVAVAVLIGVLLASSRVFTTTQRVTSVGQATANLVQDVAAMERRLRDDFRTLSREGFFALRCVAVPNDFNDGVLMNPNRPPDAMIRCDQMVFFANTSAGSSTFVAGMPGQSGQGADGAEHRGRSTASRVAYAHAFSFGSQSKPYENNQAFDPDGLVFPWSSGQLLGRFVVFQGATVYERMGPSRILLPVPDARRWLFTRHAAILADDDNADGGAFPHIYLEEVRTARSIFLNDPVFGLTPDLQSGRVDAVETQYDDIRRRVLWKDPADIDSEPRDWQSNDLGGEIDGFDLIRDQALFYPRAERYAPSMNRVDQALTNNAILTGCAEVRIEWTYDEGVGEVRDANGDIQFATGPNGIPEGGGGDDFPLFGVTYDDSRPQGQRWFGLSDLAHSRDDEKRGVFPYSALDPDDMATTIFQNSIPNQQNNIEEWDLDAQIKTYTAIFGYNQNTPLNDFGNPTEGMFYTPWPSAIRITVTVHDPNLVIENGREFQFVVDVPKRHID